MSGRISLLAVAILLGAARVEARPVHKQALAQYFGPFLTKKLNDCRTCHLPDPPGSNPTALDSDKPHNPFGARLKRVKRDLEKAGKKATLETRLDAILMEDTDGDGVSNFLEILTGHFPGDKDDRPGAAELAGVQDVLARFQKFRASYRWRPFEAVERPAVPRPKNSAWTRNPIDAFIAAEHEALGLKPRPEADRSVLLRRLYIDLIGLPPTPEELHAFLEDSAPDAYERIVDRLLASPRYGERWGRHWMDIWRYSDWAGWGAQVRDSQPHIWRWRDWIIAALNDDKGYDRMVLEMLAGDELAPEDPQALSATGYLVRNYKLLSREKWLQDTVEHTFMAFQGLTIGCAKCHDHMYDPILQTDYYRARAIFEPHQVRTDRVPGQPDIKLGGLVHAFDANLMVPTYFFIRGDDRRPDRNRPLEPGVPEFLGVGFPAIEPVILPRSAVVPDSRSFVAEETVAASAKQVAAAALSAALFTPIKEERIALSRLNLHLAEAKHDALLKLLAVEKLEDQGVKDGPAWTLARRAAGTAQRHAAVLEAKKNLVLAEQKLGKASSDKVAAAKKELADAQKALTKAETDAKSAPATTFTRRNLPAYPAQSTGRRLALAKWLVDRRNPLTARVAVNHLWLRHFGAGIVPSVFDFGRNGRLPSHPALLDWLAAEFMQPTMGGKPWSMKALHRLMVTSKTYRLASSSVAANAEIDRDNTYLWRYNSRRVEAEVVRDCVFYVAGRLDLTMGGPDIDYPLGLTVPRRSVYFRNAAEKQMEFLQIFDGPSVTECYERKQAIVPGQALALMNSELTVKNARLLARDLAVNRDIGTFIARAFEKILSRTPTPAEAAECDRFVADQTMRFKNSQIPGAAHTADGSSPAVDPELRARENLVHVLLNHHEFVTIR